MLTSIDRDVRCPAEFQSLYGQLICTPQVQRLRGVAFLGAVERFSEQATHVSAGSRYDHSLGVANLLFALRDALTLSAGEYCVALVHALLHDIGHGPFSHSSEPFFKAAFGLDHHRALSVIVEDRSSNIAQTLIRHGIWHDYRRFVRAPDSHPNVSPLFYGPINLDTIEGILRAARFFRIQTQVDTDDLINALSRRCIAVKPLDEFWSLKSQIYNEFIFADYAHADDRLCDVLESVGSRVQASDFFLDDKALEETYQSAFLEQRTASASTKGSRRREFRIRKNELPSRIATLKARYTELRGADADPDRTMQRVHDAKNQ